MIAKEYKPLHGGYLGYVYILSPLEQFKKEFDEALAAMSDQDIIDGFAEMGCEIEINPDYNKQQSQ